VSCWGTALVLACLSAAAYARTGPGLELKPAAQERTIHQAYANLAKATASGGGQGLRFEIANLRTIPADQFQKTFWLDLVTMPGGDMVDVVREATQKAGVGDFVVYRPKWRLAAGEYLLTTEGSRLNGMRVDQVLAEVARETPALRDVVAITSYDVIVRYQERSRSYRAAVQWLKPAGSGKIPLLFVDNVTQGVEEALRERPDTARPARPQKSAFLDDKVYGATCYAGSTTQHHSNSISGVDGHYFGSHSASADVDFTCTCGADCSETCDVNFTGQSCEETGEHFDSCHKMATSASLSAGSTSDARSTGPGCAVGLGCVKKSCLFCNCGLGISVNASGVNVSFASSGDPDWSGNISFNHTCGSCREVSSNPDPREYHPDVEQPPNVGGAGGYDGCHYWHTSCFGYNAGSTYYYECHPDYCLW
jgi:hypothetical protein